MRLIAVITAAALAALGAIASAADAEAAESYAIDPQHSNIAFLVDHQGFSRMLGQFQEFSGTFVLDKEAVENSSVNVTIMTASVDTDYGDRDEHLRSPDFFNAAEFPDMTFVSREVHKTSDNTAQIVGDLTLLGTTKSVTLEASFYAEGQDQFSDAYRAGFSARGTVKRSDFGMNYGIPAVGDEIALMIEIEGIRQ